MPSPRLDADIVVCVHDARKHVRRCLAAIVRHSPSYGRLILIDDASKAPCRDELEQFAAAQPRVTLIRNSRRQGYTRSANLGLRQAQAGFVVLLNSDTIVTPHWLEQLLECAGHDAKIGIVGPLSNAATFQSVPERHDARGGWARNPLPSGWTPDDVAAAVATIAPRAFPRVGMLNGFCFGMTRQVIDAIGDFDEEAFPDGYGEEQDYCLRATKAGFDLAVADHAYVYHAGTRSYDPAKREKLKRAGRAAQLRKHTSSRIRAAISSTYQEPTLRLIRETLAAVLLMPLPASGAAGISSPAPGL